MKNLRHFCAAVVLTLALSLSALADGQMHTGAAEPPPPPPSADGQMHTGVAETSETNGDEIDSVTALAVGLVQSLLSLF
jgi:hypothetical protein